MIHFISPWQRKVTVLFGNKHFTKLSIYSPTLILREEFALSKAFLGFQLALLRDVSILVASLIAFSNSNWLLIENLNLLLLWNKIKPVTTRSFQYIFTFHMFMDLNHYCSWLHWTVLTVRPPGLWPIPTIFRCFVREISAACPPPTPPCSNITQRNKHVTTGDLNFPASCYWQLQLNSGSYWLVCGHVTEPGPLIGQCWSGRSVKCYQPKIFHTSPRI